MNSFFILSCVFPEKVLEIVCRKVGEKKKERENNRFLKANISIRRKVGKEIWMKHLLEQRNFSLLRVVDINAQKCRICEELVPCWMTYLDTFSWHFFEDQSSLITTTSSEVSNRKLRVTNIFLNKLSVNILKENRKKLI